MKNIKVLGIPFNYGQGHEGVRLGYKHLCISGLNSRISPYFRTAYNEINFHPRFHEPIDKIKFLNQASAANELISDIISDMELTDTFLLNIGGDHGMGLGTVHGMLNQNPETIVVWADAHGDINTPQTSPSGNFHGMPLAFLLEKARHKKLSWIREKLLPEKLILIGPRDLDEGEKAIIRDLGICYFSSEQMNRFGTKDLLEMALLRLDPMGRCPIHLSFDVDLFDGSDVVATGTRVSEGPRKEEVFQIGEVLAQTGRLRSMDIVELNPMLGEFHEVESSTKLVLHFLERTFRNMNLPNEHKIPLIQKMSKRYGVLFGN